MISELRQALEEVARRFRRVRLWSTLAFCWLAWALFGLGLAWFWPQLDRIGIPDQGILAAYAALALASGLICAVLALRSVRDGFWVARRIEAKHPDLGTGLLAAVEQAATHTEERLGFLQSTVIRQALAHRQTHPWSDAVSDWTLRGTQLAHALALGVLAVVFASLVGQSRSHAHERNPFTLLSNSSEVQVDPGNTELERGTALLVIAKFPGAVPAEARLVVDKGAEGISRLAMTRSLDDPTFAARVESVTGDLDYHVEFEGTSTPYYHVRVFEYPELERTDAQLVFPKYTALETKTVEDIRHVTAVEGTELTLICRLNKEVASAKLVDEKGQVTPLKQQSGSPIYQANFVLSESHRYRVQLLDREGRRNKQTAEISVNVTRNRPPVITMTQPSHDVRVTPVEELTLKADINDDFGLLRQGLTYSVAGKPPQEIALGDSKTTPRQLRVEHMLDFESLQVKPDELVTYFVWAEDYGPDGKPRRTMGDMFFVEIRHFEEIFRQGEQAPPNSAENEEEQNQNNNGQAAEQLAELQKQIVNGTWKLIRREIGAKPSDKLAEDGKTLKESQQAAIEQAAQVAERLRDAKSKASLDQAVNAMKEAEKHLAEAAQTPATAPLNPALAAEQSAYQFLLKLRAREFQVSRSNRQRGQSRSGANSASDRQLQQLELSNEENRYEEQRAARAPKENLSQREQAQRETRQVLNRLRELAQRQTDLNDRLKELQSALEAAKTQEAREEIERQLKRLREQEQQILRDTDELRERMENDENRDRMAEARQQVEQGRENVRRASEALEQGRLPQALNEGARAGRQLNNLRDQIRKEASNRFSEDMTEMRNQARELDQNQKKLTEQLENLGKNPQPTLRDGGERKQVKENIEQQRQGVEKILDKMRQTVQEAEESEPLLAKELFDTVRKANEPPLPDALKGTEQMVDAGVNEEAANLSRKVGEGIEKMRQGVEKAAESVLGDETEALRRAQGELDDLADQLQREIAQSTGQPTPDAQQRPAQGQGNNRRNRATSKDQAGSRNPENGQPNPGENPNGENGQEPSPNERQAGRENGENPQAGDAQPKNQGQGQGQRQTPRQGQGQQQRGRQGQQPGQEAGQPPEPGQEKGQQPGQEEGQGQGQQPDQAPPQGEGEGQQNAQEQPGQARQGQGQGQGQRQNPNQGRANRAGQGQGGLRGGEPRQEGEPQAAPGEQQGNDAERPRQARSQRGAGGGGGGARPGDLDQVLEGLSSTGPGAPITGEGFRQWSDRLRDVEELLDDPELRSEAARIRDRARGAREEFKRHSKMPDWTQLQHLVAEPLQELRKRISEEVRRRESPDSLVPIDRDPVPPQYAEAVRRYYERLGSGR